MSENLVNKLVRIRTKMRSPDAAEMKIFIKNFLNARPLYSGQFYIELQTQADFCLRLL